MGARRARGWRHHHHAFQNNFALRHVVWEKPLPPPASRTGKELAMLLTESDTLAPYGVGCGLATSHLSRTSTPHTGSSKKPGRQREAKNHLAPSSPLTTTTKTKIARHVAGRLTKTKCQQKTQPKPFLFFADPEAVRAYESPSGQLPAVALHAPRLRKRAGRPRPPRGCAPPAAPPDDYLRGEFVSGRDLSCYSSSSFCQWSNGRIRPLARVAEEINWLSRAR